MGRPDGLVLCAAFRGWILGFASNNCVMSPTFFGFGAVFDRTLRIISMLMDHCPTGDTNGEEPGPHKWGTGNSWQTAPVASRCPPTGPVARRGVRLGTRTPRHHIAVSHDPQIRISIVALALSVSPLADGCPGPLTFHVLGTVCHLFGRARHRPRSNIAQAKLRTKITPAVIHGGWSARPKRGIGRRACGNAATVL
jgi:hypothetical protein